MLIFVPSRQHYNQTNLQEWSLYQTFCVVLLTIESQDILQCRTEIPRKWRYFYSITIKALTIIYLCWYFGFLILSSNFVAMFRFRLSSPLSPKSAYGFSNYRWWRRSFLSQKNPRERYAMLTTRITRSPRLSSRVTGKCGVGKLSQELRSRLYVRRTHD